MTYKPLDLKQYISGIMPEFQAVNSLGDELSEIGTEILENILATYVSLGIAHRKPPYLRLNLSGLPEPAAEKLIEALSSNGLDEFAKCAYQFGEDVSKTGNPVWVIEELIESIYENLGHNMTGFYHANRDPVKSPITALLLDADRVDFI